MENTKSQNKKSELKQTLIITTAKLLLAVIIIVIILGSLWAYTGNWPPIVVVESNSMMHGEAFICDCEYVHLGRHFGELSPKFKMDIF